MRAIAVALASFALLLADHQPATESKFLLQDDVSRCRAAARVVTFRFARFLTFGSL